MSTTITINRTCSRCPRVESTELTIEEATALVRGDKKKEEDPQLAVRLSDKRGVMRFDYLCSTCRQIVCRYLDMIFKKQSHKSSLRPQKEGD